MFRDAGVAEWQTHLTQNQAGNTVWVQVPPPAPLQRAFQAIEMLFFCIHDDNSFIFIRNNDIIE